MAVAVAAACQHTARPARGGQLGTWLLATPRHMVYDTLDTGLAGVGAAGVMVGHPIPINHSGHINNSCAAKSLF